MSENANSGAVRVEKEGHRSILPLVPAVMAGEFRNGATGRAIAEGLRSTGWMIEEVDHNQFFGRHRGAIAKAIGRLFRKSFRRSFNENILNACEFLGAKVFVGVKGNDVDHATIMTLRDRCVRTVIYYPDVDFSHPGVDPAVIRDVDILITTKSFQMDWLRSVRGSRSTYFLPHGYYPVFGQTEVSVAEENYDYDIAYVGNPDRHKLSCLVKVASAFPHRKMLVAGNRWRRAAAGTELEPFVLEHPLTGDFLADIHRRSRINIAIHMGRQSSGWEDLVSTRTFEIPAYGGFMLHVDNPEVRGLYEVGEEIGVFTDEDDLISKIEFYLARPEVRRRMIERAYRRAVPNYSYHNRGVQMDGLLRPHIMAPA